MAKLPDEQREIHAKYTSAFIKLANDLKDEGGEIQVISAALMSASGIYATYTTSGNEGYLHQSGIDKVTEVYKNNLTFIQSMKKAEAEKGNA
ncbi:DUF3144 domain-containing protein [Pseudoteredinibacter isoporae]|uniref:DUF3144 domain-containing protein n=1 Tax=Pseudoteredinibacter isoporae TaxID=570281 RepID=A0A7X0MXP8_9GAMM|nr:DUF3144 domain-containing protein [Pseudoteredinibacter isoporae]MBB6521177.1 hypothetical protein [Pseudoteredinibacter isoporae]NHO86737.1 DUF3144 domain-containing protein [Pseudoteredinibacter isoporae]NIB24811.1 DUF3144 domain-containing protein [Pseudoteredinibacter isoporae]